MKKKKKIQRILFAKTFGIGNAVMALPALRAIRAACPSADIDVVVGETSDDAGAFDVFSLVQDLPNIQLLKRPSVFRYDTAVLSIPYDGRWREGSDFFADVILDGRTRPDPSTTGLVSWKKHEIEYQMENAHALGYVGEIPTCRFMPSARSTTGKVYYLGVGYKKDAAGFWKIKHWGNEKFAALVKMILADDPRNVVWSTGDAIDLERSIQPIFAYADGPNPRMRFCQGSIKESFNIVNQSDFYVGNDTGMMHVAASAGKKVLGIFKMKNAIVKNRPWCDEYRAIDGHDRDVSPEEVFAELKSLERS